MKTESGKFYHIFNQGNRGHQVFFSDANYLLFLRLFRKLTAPHCDLMAYCLLPHQFSFIIYANEQSVTPKKVGLIWSTCLANGFRLLQSTYARLINAERSETGSLFRQKAQAYEIEEDQEYMLSFLHYIHVYPVKEGLVRKPADWSYSSYRDFSGLRKGALIKVGAILDLMSWSPDKLVPAKTIPEEQLFEKDRY